LFSFFHYTPICIHITERAARLTDIVIPSDLVIPVSNSDPVWLFC